MWVLSHKRTEGLAAGKLTKRWRGPFIVLEQIHEVTVRVRPMGSNGSRSSLHVEHVKPFRLRNGRMPNLKIRDAKVVEEEPGVEGEDMEAYEAEEVVDFRVEEGELMLCIKFRGYDYGEWIPEADAECQDLVEEFFSSRAVKPSETEKWMPREGVKAGDQIPKPGQG